MLKKKIGWSPLDEFRSVALEGVDRRTLQSVFTSPQLPTFTRENISSEAERTRSTQNANKHLSAIPLRKVPVPTPPPANPTIRTNKNSMKPDPAEKKSDHIVEEIIESNYASITKTISLIEHEKEKVLLSLKKDLMSGRMKALRPAPYRVSIEQHQQWKTLISHTIESEELQTIVSSERIQQEVEKRIDELTGASMFASPPRAPSPPPETKNSSKNLKRTTIDMVEDGFSDDDSLDRWIRDLNKKSEGSQKAKNQMKSGSRSPIKSITLKPQPAEELDQNQQMNASNPKPAPPSRMPGYSFGKAGLKPLPEYKRPK
jgi:hypothetical protein